MSQRYNIIPIEKQQVTGSEYYTNNVYPDVAPTEEDDYVITVLGDRLDLLANDFYGDPTLWWVIASANALSGDSLYPEPGTQLRIPSNVLTVLNQYNSFNSLR